MGTEQLQTLVYTYKNSLILQILAKELLWFEPIAVQIPLYPQISQVPRVFSNRIWYVILWKRERENGEK